MEITRHFEQAILKALYALQFNLRSIYLYLVRGRLSNNKVTYACSLEPGQHKFFSLIKLILLKHW